MHGSTAWMGRLQPRICAVVALCWDQSSWGFSCCTGKVLGGQSLGSRQRFLLCLLRAGFVSGRSLAALWWLWRRRGTMHHLSPRLQLLGTIWSSLHHQCRFRYNDGCCDLCRLLRFGATSALHTLQRLLLHLWRGHFSGMCRLYCVADLSRTSTKCRIQLGASWCNGDPNGRTCFGRPNRPRTVQVDMNEALSEKAVLDQQREVLYPFSSFVILFQSFFHPFTALILFHPFHPFQFSCILFPFFSHPFSSFWTPFQPFQPFGPFFILFHPFSSFFILFHPSLSSLYILFPSFHPHSGSSFFIIVRLFLSFSNSDPILSSSFFFILFDFPIIFPSLFILLDPFSSFPFFVHVCPGLLLHFQNAI